MGAVIHVDKQAFEAGSAGQYKLEIDNSSSDLERVTVTITMQVFPPGDWGGGGGGSDGDVARSCIAAH